MPNKSTAYFPNRDLAHKAIQPWIDKHYPNRFQDAMSVSRIKIVEFDRGFAVQLGDYGRYLTTLEIATA